MDTWAKILCSCSPQGPHRPEAQDVALSRPKHGFESRWGRHLFSGIPPQRHEGSRRKQEWGKKLPQQLPHLVVREAIVIICTYLVSVLPLPLCR